MKVVFVLFRKHGLTHDESLAQWKGEQHTSIVRMIPGLKRWVQNHAIAAPTAGAADGIGELWFDSPGTMEQAMNSPPNGGGCRGREEISRYGKDLRSGRR